MGPVNAATETATAAVGARVGAGSVVGVAVGMAAGVEILVGGTGASPPHAEIPVRNAASAKADINRGHRYIPEF